MCVFSGSAPKPVSQRQNIFVRVFRWTWISRPTTVSHASSQPLRDEVEAERALERVPGAEERVLGELRADELQADRQALGEPARDREARAGPAMQDGIVSRSDAYIASGSAARSPIGNATVGEVAETIRSNLSKTAACSRMITVRTCCALP